MTRTAGALESRIRDLVLDGAPLDVVFTLLQRDGLVDPADPELEGQITYEFDRFARSLSSRQHHHQVAAKKAAWMIAIYRELRRVSGDDGIGVMPVLDRDEFFRSYYFRNRPLKLPQLCAQWQSFEHLTVARLVETYGDAAVEVMVGRNARPDHEFNYEACRRMMPLRSFAALLAAAPATGTDDFYMVAKNGNLRGSLAPALQQVAPLPGVQGPHGPQTANLWIGPAGTVTKLHHDTENVLFVQVAGRKTVWLVPPYETELVYNEWGPYSAVDAENPDLVRFPLFRGATVQTVTIEEGDALFIPVGWWHQVRALSESVTLTLKNFAAVNYFHINLTTI